MPSDTNLFAPTQVGALGLRSRIVMSPLTRSHAGQGDAPTKLNAK